MRISTKCSIALHLLIVIEVFKNKKWTSEILGKSSGCNPAMIRSLLGKLKKAGIISINRGTGGATLIVDPLMTTIWDVYKAVDDDLGELVGLHPNPLQECPVGAKIYELLDKPYKNIVDSVKESMMSCTLKELIDDYYMKKNKK